MKANIEKKESKPETVTPAVLIKNGEMTPETRYNIELYMARRRYEGTNLTLPAAIIELVNTALNLTKP